MDSASGADEALAIAKRNADATRELVETTRSTAIAEIRAYLFASSARYTFNGRYVDIVLTIKNLGKSPAGQIMVSYPINEGFPNQVGHSASIGDIGAGDYVEFSGQWRDLGDPPNNILNRFFKGEITYTDVFIDLDGSAKRHRVPFGFTMPDPPHEQTGALLAQFPLEWFRRH